MGKEDRVRLAISGLGAWSFAMGNGVVNSNKAALVACFTRTPEKRKAWSEKFQCDQEESFEAVIKRDDVEAVILTTPNRVHAEQTIMAAEYGKHVFVDKPIANTISDAKQMIEACEKAGVVLMTGHYMRRWAGYRKLKELVAGGAIGDPVQVDTNASSNLGFALTPDKFRWKGDDSGCPAGALMTLGVHNADTLNHIFGPIKRVSSFFNKLHIDAPVVDVTSTILEFESGVLGYLGSNYASPRANWMYIYGTEANVLCTVIMPELPFEESMLRMQLLDQDTRVQIFEKGKTGYRDIPLTEGNPIVEEIDEFADCIRTGKRPETDGNVGLVALALIRAAIESARTGRPTKLEY